MIHTVEMEELIKCLFTLILLLLIIKKDEIEIKEIPNCLMS